jgi:uncharacterized phage-associated protein
MAYSAMAVANSFIRLAHDGGLPDLTSMKLQKLLYLVQALHLSTNGDPLIDDHFARWTYGPVVPSVYHGFLVYKDLVISSFGGYAIKVKGDISVTTPGVSGTDSETWLMIDEVVNMYGSYSGAQLSAILVAPGSAWALSGPVEGEAIPRSLIASDWRRLHAVKAIARPRLSLVQGPGAAT